MRAGYWIAALAVVGVLTTGGVAQAAEWTVNNYADPAGSTCPLNCSLRQAVNQSGAGDTIHIPAQNGLPVQLTQGTPILISHALTITGDGADVSSIDGSANRDGRNLANRIFKVAFGGDLQLNGVTLTGGGDEADETCQSGCSTITSTGGGALYVESGASAELSEIRLVNNHAGVGGAIASAGRLDLSDVAFSQDAAAFGGGLFVRTNSATVRRSSFDQLGSGGSGGGAAFVYGGSLTLLDSTVTNSGNPASRGGGLENYGGSLALSGVTLAGNLRGAIMTDTGASTTATDTLIGAGFDDGGDFACVPSGVHTGSGATAARAITTDGGHNLDEDGHCGLTGAGDVSGDAHLAPPADNGGSTPTMALLHGSPALDGGSECSPTDQRGVDRPPECDIGAFEAELHGPPAAATTEAATDIGPSGATLHATVDLTGESGGAHFVWGTAPDDLGSTTGVGASGQGTDASVDLGGLSPFTTYYFRAVADNASGQRPADDPPLSFTTAAAPPGVSGVEVNDVEDTSVSLSFEIDTGGADTAYAIEYGPDDSYGQSTAPVHLDAQPQRQPITAKLTGLKPGSTYHVNVVATNSSAPDGIDSGDNTFATDPQVAADAGAVLTVTDSRFLDFCPDADAQIDWGDGSPGEAVPVTCNGQGGVSVTATHAYAAPGRFRIVIDYGGPQAQQWAVIATPAQATPTPTPSATPTPSQTPTPTPTPTPPAPQFHQQVVVKPVSGVVLVRLKGTNTFVPVNAATGVPLGSQVDVTHGRIQLSSVPKRGGKPQTAEFYGGVFTVTQPGAITDLALSGPKPTCSPKGRASAAATKKKVKSRSLWGDGHGSFRTRGTYSAATVRGTQWLVRDTCAGTLTRVVHGVVSVRDNVRHRTRLLRAGQRYLARPRTR